MFDLYGEKYNEVDMSAQIPRKVKIVMLELLVATGCFAVAFAALINTENKSEDEKPKGKANHLINEKSPYLRQHAYNPVDWYPWGEEAFAKARAENKPIFLSIGYSTCHWCHVMERESFESDSIAEIMNKYFVNIKVDREERPDIDQVYMTAVQAMTGSGGWPLSIFLTPDLKPFFGGGYFPPQARYGRPGFADLLRRINEVWTNQREEVIVSGNKIASALQQYSSVQPANGTLAESLLTRCYDELARSYEPQYGGFGSAPKFPRPVALNFMLRYYARNKNQHALDMTLFTLRKMAEGGIHDQLGGGFHRYSVDNLWRVPHFEKMLYDQAQLAVSYLEAFQITKDVFYANVARDILDYVLHDMMHPDGGFYSAEDADSEGEEGKFYVWTKREIDSLLADEQARIFNHYFGISEEGNFEHGKNVLHTTYSVEETVKAFGINADELQNIIHEGKQKLFAVRGRRIRPHLDDKILTSWNGLMISAFARAYQVLDEMRYLAAAEQASNFILNTLYNMESKTLLHRYRDGEAKIDGYLDDYAFFIQGLLDLYESAFKTEWLTKAIELTETQNRLFWDMNNGGFFFDAGIDSSVLIHSKTDYDSAEPSGNSIAVMNLLRLSQMTDNQEWRQMAEKTLRFFAGRLEQAPSAMPQMLVAFDFYLDKPKQIIIAGKPDADDTKAMLRAVHERFIPNKIILFADGGEEQKRLAKYLPFVQSIALKDNKATAYLCENYVCKLPTNDVKIMDEMLKKY